jgi:hypothetical protein
MTKKLNKIEERSLKIVARQNKPRTAIDEIVADIEGTN